MSHISFLNSNNACVFFLKQVVPEMRSTSMGHRNSCALAKLYSVTLMKSLQDCSLFIRGFGNHPSLYFTQLLLPAVSFILLIMSVEAVSKLLTGEDVFTTSLFYPLSGLAANQMKAIASLHWLNFPSRCPWWCCSCVLSFCSRPLSFLSSVTFLFVLPSPFSWCDVWESLTFWSEACLSYGRIWTGQVTGPQPSVKGTARLNTM